MTQLDRGLRLCATLSPSSQAHRQGRLDHAQQQHVLQQIWRNNDSFTVIELNLHLIGGILRDNVI